MKKRKTKIQDYTVLFMIGLALLFLILRAPYGWCFNDEPFLVTLAQRIYMGDSLLVDEWNPSQVTGVLLLPFYALFHIFSRDNTGILLTFRYFYCVLWFATCVVVFRTVKQQSKSRITSLCVFFYLILFAPLDYMTLSYTSLGLMSCLLLCCLLLNGGSKSRTPWYVYSMILSFLIGSLVLCAPHMVLAYIVAWVGAVVLLIKKGQSDDCVYYEKSKVLSIAYLGVAAGVYCYYLIFSRIDLMSLLPSIQMILAKPDSVMRSNILVRLFYCVKSIINKSLIYSLCIVGCSLMSTFFRKRMRHIRVWMFALCSAGFLWAQFCFLTDQMDTKFNYQMIDIALLGFAAFAMLDTRPWNLFYSFSCIGFVYTLLRWAGTDTGLFSAGMTLTVCGVSSIIFVILLCQEMREQYKENKIVRVIPMVLCTGILILQLFSESYVKLFRQYWDRSPVMLRETVEVGAAKGLRTNRDDKQAYEARYAELKQLLENVDEDNPDIGFVSLTSSPIIYLDANLRFGVFSSWTFPYCEVLCKTLEQYREINPKCRQTVFFAEKDDVPEDFKPEQFEFFKAQESVLFASPAVLRQP